MTSFLARSRTTLNRWYNIWKYGLNFEYQIRNEDGTFVGVTDTMNSHIFSFHLIGGGETARQHMDGGWSIDWTLHQEYEPDPDHSIDSFDVRRYTKWQYMTIREKKSVDPSVFRDWFHPTRPPVIQCGQPPQLHKIPWEQQQLVLHRRWQMLGIPPKPGNAFHMHNCPHKDNAEDWYWPFATYDEFMVALNKARYLKSKSGQKEHKKAHDIRMRRETLNAPQV